MTCLSPRDALLFSLATLTPQITHLAAPFDDADLDPVILRDYQMRVLREAVAYFRMGFRRVLIQLPTGGGKTVLAAQVLLAVLAAGGFSQFIVHRKELLNQTSRSFTAMGLPHGFIAADRPLDLEAATILAGVQTLVNRLDVVLPPNLVVLDECFIAGTLVEGRPIETLKVGDTVTAFDEASGEFHARKINRLWKRQLRGCVVRVRVFPDVETICTPSHPFWTKRGWVNAGDLTENDEVLSCNHSMPHLRQPGADECKAPPRRVAPKRSGFLQQRVLPGLFTEGEFHSHGTNQSEVCFRADEAQQSHAPRRRPRADDGHHPGDAPQAEGSGRQRATDDGGRNEATGDIWRSRVRPTVHRADRYAARGGVGSSLQDRLRQPPLEDRHRGGRCVPQYAGEASAGSEEGRVFDWARVERVQVLEQDDLGEACGGAFDGYVYNIEVDDLHTYVANGIVVHNCHHAVAGTWERVLAAYPDAYILGLTATPERLDGRGLGEHFDVMVLGPTTAELIERGFLSPYDYYAPHRPDLSGLHTLGGDYNQTEVQALMDRPELVGDMVSHYLRLASGQKGIVFASSIPHSRNLTDAFRAAGVRAAHLDGTSKDREAVMEGFCGDQYDVLSNVDLFDEGLDVPGIVYVGMGRPTKSMTKYRQQAGRALRLAEGETRAIIADHAGNAFTHGLPDDDYEWTLEGRTKGARGACNDDAEPVRQCLTCYRVYPSKVKACPGCGAAQTPTAREIKIREGELEKLERERLKVERAERRKAEERACQTYDDYYRLAVARGYNEPVKWARVRSSMKSGSFRFR